MFSVMRLIITFIAYQHLGANPLSHQHDPDDDHGRAGHPAHSPGS
jgi:hypothetical protein